MLQLFVMSLDLSSEAITWTGAEQYCLEVMKRLDIQRRSEEFCDVILNVGSGIHQARLKAHRNVLSAASPFFYNALNSDMKEKEEGVISLEETSKTIMDGVLEYMYTGYVDVSAENVPELFAQADYFILPSLTYFLSNFIIQTLSLSKCVKAYYLACKYQCERLMKETRGFILSNFVAVAKTEDFLNLSCEQVEEWISSDEVVVDVEEKVFEVVLRWAERDESRKQNDFRDLFRHLRCGYVSRDYLFEVLLPHPLVRENSGCLSSVFNAMKSALDGTEECLFLQAPRQCLKSHEDTVVACRENRALCYLPPTQKWFELPKMNSSFRSTEQTEHAIGVCHGRLYIIGRTTTRGYGSTSCIAERYEPSLNKWFQVNQQTLLHFLLLPHSRDLFTFWVERTARIHHGILYRNTTLTLICGRRSCHLVALEQKFVPLLMEVIYMLLGAVIQQISTWTLLRVLIPEAILGINFHQCIQGGQVQVVRQSRKKCLYLEGPSQKE